MLISGAGARDGAERPPQGGINGDNDLGREGNQMREDEAASTNLDHRDVILTQVLLEWQVCVAGQQDIEPCRDRRSKEVAIGYALPTEVADMLHLVRREVGGEANGEILIEEHAHFTGC